MHVSQSFGSHCFTPENTCLVVIIHCGGAFHKRLFEVEILKYKQENFDLLGAFVGDVYFGFCQTTRGIGLAL